MNKQDNGGSAFPNWDSNHYTDQRPQGGMDLRDYFAAKAMQAAATNPTGAEGLTFDQRAEWAYQQADAMLKARQA